MNIIYEYYIWNNIYISNSINSSEKPCIDLITVYALCVSVTFRIMDTISFCFSFNDNCCILAFDPAKNANPRWCTGRKWHTPMPSNRKRSRGRIKADNMGQVEGPTVPLQSDAPEESDLWTAWQLFPFDED